ncbi:hypothetical protein QCF72_gp58 [Escherichia phage vB_EcoS_fPoEco01]|uniref:hypothetical protein n=1 Tax=Escherichia phage vB_EcoS_fPoEco01 TaxID=2762429 RepID=UPI0018609ABF|nr:hypothetical protein QCF72_gp58 [Escherichia phage vB_EcoS_fPoEco01]QNO11844.1 hypothetical protein PE1_057 [Escherichia phage vB_EcoS_fPoEco01]
MVTLMIMEFENSAATYREMTMAQAYHTASHGITRHHTASHGITRHHTATSTRRKSSTSSG